MSLDQIATTDFIEKQFAAFLEKIQSQAPTVVKDEEFYYSVDKVAELTDYSRQTVDKWIKHGKEAPSGKIVKLKVFRFAAGENRIKKTDLEAFGQVAFEEEWPEMRKTG